MTDFWYWRYILYNKFNSKCIIFNYVANKFAIFCVNFINAKFDLCPELRRNNLLNLSISVSRGKENNNDSCSNGEWTRKSPALNLFTILVLRTVAYRYYFLFNLLVQVTPDWGFIEGDRPVLLERFCKWFCLGVGLFGNAAQSRW